MNKKVDRAGLVTGELLRF